MASNLGELLLREKILSVDQLKSALEFQKKNSLPVGTSVVQLGFLTEEDIAQALSRQLGYPYIDLDQFEVYAEVITLIPVDVAKKYMVMPIHRIRNFLTLAMVDPTDLEIIEDVRFRTGLSHPARHRLGDRASSTPSTSTTARPTPSGSRRSSRTSPWPTTAGSTSSRTRQRAAS